MKTTHAATGSGWRCRVVRWRWRCPGPRRHRAHADHRQHELPKVILHRAVEARRRATCRAGLDGQARSTVHFAGSVDRDVFRRQLRYEAQAAPPPVTAGCCARRQVRARPTPPLFPSIPRSPCHERLQHRHVKFFQIAPVHLPEHPDHVARPRDAIERFGLLNRAQREPGASGRGRRMLNAASSKEVQGVTAEVRRGDRQDRQLRPGCACSPGRGRPPDAAMEEDDGDRAAPGEAHAHRHLRQRDHARVGLLGTIIGLIKASPRWRRVNRRRPGCCPPRSRSR